MLDVLCVGHASYDVSMAIERHPGPGEKIFADAMHLSGGEPAANAAVCAARLGGKAGFCGYLGNDLFGDLHMSEFAAEGVDVSLVQRGPYPSPVSQILAKPDGCRALVNFKGDTPWLDADAVEMPLSPKVMLFDSHEPQLSSRLCHQAADGIKGEMAAFDIDAVDSTGAGDAFHGAFALGLARNMQWNELLRFASAAGALTCTKLGARQALPTSE